jgi:hypothetical protein
MMKGKERKKDERCPFNNGSYAVNMKLEMMDGKWLMVGGLKWHILRPQFGLYYLPDIGITDSLIPSIW